MAILPDRDLLARFRAGDAGALDALFGRYEAAVFQFLIGMLRDRHLAEDALQETFVRALERLDGVDPDHFRGWLFTVAYHQAMLTRRRRRPAGSLEDDGVIDTAPDPFREAARRDDADRLRRLLDRLPEGQREVIRRRVYEGKRFQEIAADLQCPLNTALSRMHEGLKRLRLLWERENA